MFFGKDCFGETDVSKFVVVSPVEFVIWNLWEFVGYKKDTMCFKQRFVEKQIFANSS